VPVRLWGFDHRDRHPTPSFEQLAVIAREYAPELLMGWQPRVTQETSAPTEQETRPCRHEGFVEDVTTIHTPKGDLITASLRSLEGRPGYASKYLIETPEDAEKWLSIPWTAPQIDASDWGPALERMGEDGLLMVGFREPMYTINQLTGSQVWAYWLIEQRELLHRLVAEAQRRELHIIKQSLAAGVIGVYGYVGPELCIPPLAGPADFDDFVVRYDAPIHDLIHNAGGMVWLHCHGKMDPVLERFADEAVDCLNPMEPPPMGDVTVADARRRVGDRMSLEGGIEVQDVELCTANQIEERVTDAIWQSEGIGFILSLSSDLSHLPTLSPLVLENMRTFFATARREGERVCSA